MERRNNLIPLFDTILICGKLGLPFRGHNNKKPDAGTFSGYGGNYVELLNYRVRGGDSKLGKYIETAPKNTNYMSAPSQNEMITVCGQAITDKIVKEIKAAKFYSVLADEAFDKSGKEQMSVVIRFVDKECNIREDFLRFVHCDDGVSGEALADKMLSCLYELGLDTDDCRARWAGKIRGFSARILARNRKALYIHCYPHKLNFCVAKSCSVTPVKNMMDGIKKHI